MPPSTRTTRAQADRAADHGVALHRREAGGYPARMNARPHGPDNADDEGAADRRRKADRKKTSYRDWLAQTPYESDPEDKAPDWRSQQ